MAPHRVAIIEDDAEIRALLELMLEHDERFRHVGSAVDGHSGVALVSELQPDLAVLDLELPGLSGLDAIGLIGVRAPQTKIVVFSGFADPLTLMDVLRLGADAYLDKASAWSELLPTMAALCDRSVDVH